MAFVDPAALREGIHEEQSGKGIQGDIVGFITRKTTCSWQKKHTHNGLTTYHKKHMRQVTPLSILASGGRWGYFHGPREPCFPNPRPSAPFQVKIYLYATPWSDPCPDCQPNYRPCCGRELAISPYRPRCCVVSYAWITLVWLSSAAENAYPLCLRIRCTCRTFRIAFWNCSILWGEMGQQTCLYTMAQ
jgi:hypothetical protein